MATNIYGNVSAGKVSATNVYLGVDASGNFVGDSSNNVASLQAVLVTAEYVSANTIRATNFVYSNLDLSGSQVIAQNLTVNGTTLLNILNVKNNVDVSGNLTVHGTTQVDLGLTVASGGADITGDSTVTGNIDVSGYVHAKEFATPGGFSVDLSGNVTAHNISATGEIVYNLLSANTISTPGGFSVDASGAVMAVRIDTSGGFSVDALGNVIISNTLKVKKATTFDESVSISKGLYVNAGAYINKEYVNIFTVGDSLNGNGVSMYSSGTTLNVTGITQDSSSLNFPINVAVKGGISTTGGFSVDSSGNTVTKTITTPGGFSVGSSGNTSTNTFSTPGGFSVGSSGNTSTNTFSTPGGFSIGSSGNVTTNTLSSKTITTPGGFSIDVSGNVNVSNTSTFVGVSLFNQSVELDQSLYIASGAYINKQYTNLLTVGDSSDNDGVTMYTSGTNGSTLNISGIVQDLSSTIFPIDVAIKGSLSLIDASSNNAVTMYTTYDGSDNAYVLGLTFPDSSGIVSASTGGGTTFTIPIVINDVNYYIQLHSARS